MEDVDEHLRSCAEQWCRAEDDAISRLADILDDPDAHEDACCRRLVSVINLLCEELYDQKVVLFTNHAETFEAYCRALAHVFPAEEISFFGAGMSAEEIAACIRADEIDILVDLAGHTQNNCLPVLAYKPAPVQVTGIGYFNTTGLPAIDYMLSDVHVDPIETTEPSFTEKMIRLPHSHFCYVLPEELPPVAPPPMERSGFVTFGSFNNFNKVTDEVLRLWKEVLDAVPRSRLLVKSKLLASAEGRERAAERFSRCGISTERVEMRAFSRDHLAEYGDMDIALDTFPYTGGITTCEALAMGVPVVTLRGASHGARFGESLLTNANLTELIADTPADYVQIASTLASAPETLAALRTNLRTILAHAPLTDARTYVRDVEAAYAEIWERFVRAAGRM